LAIYNQRSNPEGLECEALGETGGLKNITHISGLPKKYYYPASLGSRLNELNFSTKKIGTVGTLAAKHRFIRLLDVPNLKSR
jgi:hypothetical protein